MSKNVIKKKSKDLFFIDRLQYALLVVFISLVFIIGDNSSLVLLYYIPLAAFIMLEAGFALNNKKTMFTKHILLAYLFAFVCLLTFIWAPDSGAVASRFFTLFLLVTSLLFMYNYCLRTSKTVSDLVAILLIAGTALSIYLICYYGINGILDIFNSGYLRLGHEIDNENAIGMELAATAISAVYFGFRNKKYYLLAIVPVILTFGTASKNAFFFVIMGTILLILLDEKNRRTFGGLVKKLILPVFILIISIIIIQSNVFPTLTRRMDAFSSNSDGSTVVRDNYIKHGFDYFLNNPLFGTGVNNANVLTMSISGANTYLHNNYIELLATTGIVGFSIYYYIFASLLFVAFKNRTMRDASIVITLLALCLVMDWGTVSYYDKITYIFILIAIVFYSNAKRKDENVKKVD